MTNTDIIVIVIYLGILILLSGHMLKSIEQLTTEVEVFKGNFHAKQLCVRGEIAKQVSTLKINETSEWCNNAAWIT